MIKLSGVSAPSPALTKMVTTKSDEEGQENVKYQREFALLAHDGSSLPVVLVLGVDLRQDGGQVAELLQVVANRPMGTSSGTDTPSGTSLTSLPSTRP